MTEKVPGKTPCIPWEETEMSAGPLMVLHETKRHMLMTLFSCFAGTALSALPQVLISMLFLCLGGALHREGPTLARPEE